MRLAASVTFAVVTASSLIARAERPLVVWQNRTLHAGEPKTAPLAPISHKLYLNDCLPNGCTVSPGNDNSITNRSSIPQSTVTLNGYPHGTAHWNALVDCVRDTFKPFNVDIVTDDPGNSSHFEVMIGGTSQQLNPQLNAGGVAPFIDCSTTINNVISFVFAETTANLNFLCGAVAQEAAHVWGLDHELNADDPMTYLELGSSKRFQNDDANCGEDTPRRCFCGGSTQNSFRFMTNAFGLSGTLMPTSMTLDTPKDGAWVKPNFAVRATFTSELSLLSGSLLVDGQPKQEAMRGLLAFNVPGLTAGEHTIAVTATDAADRSEMVSVKIKQLVACGAGNSCANGFNCIDQICYPGANEAGGVGAACSKNEDCLTSACALDGEGGGICTGTCASGCPEDFDCVDNICWPKQGGGCASGGAGSGTAAGMLAGLSGLVLVLRRRR